MKTVKEGKNCEFHQGIRDGLPIGAGYFAVSFSLGITAQRIGMTPIQGFFLSLLNNASAGEYAGMSAMVSGTSLGALAVLILITNARYLLMSCSLSQKLSPSVGTGHRLLIAWGITDELFGIGIARKGQLTPSYLYGAYLSALSCWATGTACGVIAGDVLPVTAVSALSASIFGMFLAVILPPARKDKAVAAVVGTGFILSGLFSYLPIVRSMSGSLRVILLTLVISLTAALIRPVEEQEENTSEAEAVSAADMGRPVRTVSEGTSSVSADYAKSGQTAAA